MILPPFHLSFNYFAYLSFLPFFIVLSPFIPRTFSAEVLLYLIWCTVQTICIQKMKCFSSCLVFFFLVSVSYLSSSPWGFPSSIYPVGTSIHPFIFAAVIFLRFSVCLLDLSAVCIGSHYCDVDSTCTYYTLLTVAKTKPLPFFICFH